MEQSEKLLQSIVENARMGRSACKQLLERIKDEKILGEIRRERDSYEEIIRRGEAEMKKMRIEPKPEGMMQRMGLYMGMEMNTLTDRSAAHTADILIQGATMGIVEMTKARNSNPEACEAVRSIAADFIVRQQQAIDRLKAHLLQKA